VKKRNAQSRLPPARNRARFLSGESLRRVARPQVEAMLIPLIPFFALFRGAPPLPIMTPAAATVTQAATAPSAADIVNKVQAFYANVQQVTAKFRQEVTNVNFGQTSTSDGMVWISKPGKMRWDYYGKPHEGKVAVTKSFISNGKYLYVVEHDNKQVYRKDLEKDLMPVAISFLYGKGDLKTEFTPALDNSGKYGSKDDIVLALTPKQQSAQYKMLYLVVDPGNYRVKQSVIIDSSNNVNQFRFYEPDFEKKVDAAWFEFNEKSVKNYKITDADTVQAGSGSGSGAGSGSGGGSGSGSASGSASGSGSNAGSGSGKSK
jgi:outer membrane lipoprotein-sorting protein